MLKFFLTYVFQQSSKSWEGGKGENKRTTIIGTIRIIKKRSSLLEHLLGPIMRDIIVNLNWRIFVLGEGGS